MKMNKVQGDILEFTRTKKYIYEKELGQGGTGRAILMRDDITEMLFACKKYEPYDNKNKERFFKNFIEEIKILYQIPNINIVKIFNYHLYPEKNLDILLWNILRV